MLLEPPGAAPAEPKMLFLPGAGRKGAGEGAPSGFPEQQGGGAAILLGCLVVGRGLGKGRLKTCSDLSKLHLFSKCISLTD